MKYRDHVIRPHDGGVVAFREVDGMMDYIVVMRDPETLVKHRFSYSREDANDVWGDAMVDHPDLDVCFVEPVMWFASHLADAKSVIDQRQK